MKQVVMVLAVIALANGCGQFQGRVQVKHLGILQAEGHYTNGVQTGVWTYYDGAGKVLGQGTYDKGKMVSGMEVAYHDNGQKASEGYWVSGLRDGHWVHYYRSGRKEMEGSYLYGKKSGLWKTYDPSGYYTTEKIYENDKVTGWRDYKLGRIGHPWAR